MDWWGLLFPKRCCGCGRIGEYVCAECLNWIRPMKEAFCPICRRPAFGGETHPRCKQKLGLDGLISGYIYQGLMKRVVAKFKYKFVEDLNKTLVELLISGLESPKLLEPDWTLVPVPLHQQRERWRGFNQAEVLAAGLAREWNWPMRPDLLVRQRETKSQMKLTGVKRKINLKGAFETNNGAVPNKVMLVDDVATSCSTLRECGEVLKRAGAKEVWGLTLAQAIP